MSDCNFGFAVLLQLVLLYSVQGEMPELLKSVEPCANADPKLEACITNIVEKLRPLLLTGVPDYSIPMFEPLTIPKLVLDQPPTDDIKLKSTVTNVEIYGPSKFVIKDMEINPARDAMKITVTLPRLDISAQYTVDGSIMMLPISGEGVGFVNITDIEGKADAKASIFKSADGEHYKVEDLSVTFEIGDGHIQLNNLFGGDEALGTAANNFLNENWRQVLAGVKPIIITHTNDIIKKMANDLLAKNPISMFLKA